MTTGNTGRVRHEQTGIVRASKTLRSIVGYDRRMQRTARITPRMAVLGLVVQEPGTVADIGRRLAVRFGSAGFPRSSVHKNLPSLAKDGRVCLVEPGATPKLDRYEASTQGVAEVREWLRRPSLPAIPDVLDGLLAFAEPEDLPAVLSTIREDEQASRAECDLAHGRVLTHKRLLRRMGAVSWRERLCMLGLEHQAKRWGDRAEELALLGDKLERLLKDIAASET